MNILTQAFHITPAKRRIMAALAMIVALTSTHVQAVQSQVLPGGFVVPEDAPTPPKKKVWNTINSADLVTKAEHSSEPAIRTMVVPTTAYTSAIEECDSSPFTTANGTRVYDGVIAANFLKFGTRVRIPDQFGDKVFVVQDRMNARYTKRVDIWMTTKAEAFKWGVRTVKIEILP